MDEYIKRSEVLDMAYWHGDHFTVDRFSPDGSDAVDVADIKDIPAADVVLVKHGRWEDGNAICPVCGKDKFKDLDADIWCDWKPAYCPNCGAKMD